MLDDEPKIEEKFTAELERIIDYFRSEFNITYAQAIGSLEMVTFSLQSEAYNDD